jgi:protein-disulfide isomerase
MKTAGFIAKVAGVALAALLVVAPTRAQTGDDTEELRQEIEALKAGQDAIQKDLAEIKQLLQQQPRQDRRASAVQAVEGTVAVGSIPVKGDAGARVTLIEFSDYQCPYCRRHVNNTLPKLAEEYIAAGKLRYAFRDFPLEQIHKDAFGAAEAARCAGEQGRYWEMHDRLFAQGRALGRDQLPAHAEAAGLDVAAFTACLETGQYADAVRADLAEGGNLGVSATPTFFLGLTDGDQIRQVRQIRGAQPYSVFKAEIDKLLAEGS